nr:uncharacterized protein LOC115492417 [Taeniopygia guttata]
MSMNEPLRDAESVAAGRTFQAPLLATAHKPSSHRRGPPIRKSKATEHKKPHEPSKHMWQMLKEIKEAGQEMDGEAVLKAEFLRGSSGSLAASAAGREALPGTGDSDCDLQHLEMLLNHGLRILESGEAKREDEEDLDSQPIPITEPLGYAEGVAAERSFPGSLVDAAQKPSSHRRGPLRRKSKLRGDMSLEASKHMDKTLSDLERHRDAAGTSARGDKIWKSMRRDFCWGTSCLMKMMAIVAGAAFGLMMCSAGIWYCWKTKSSASAASQDQMTSAMQICAYHQPFPSQFPTCLPQLHYPLTSGDMLPPPITEPSVPKGEPIPVSSNTTIPP